MDAAIDQLPGMACTLGLVLDGKGLDLLAPEGVRGFGDRHAFAGAGIDDAQRPVRGFGGRQRGECSFERGFIRGEVPVLDEVAGEPREHEGHGNLLALKMKGCGHARVHVR